MRNSMDAEMTDMEVQYNTPQCQQDDVVREMLTVARQLISEGKPSQALQAVIKAVKTMGGEAAVQQSLDRARELYIKKRQENVAVDRLASLFAECAIAEAEPTGYEHPPHSMNCPAVLPDTQGTILAETGRSELVLEAFSDGSSFVCLSVGVL